MLPWKEQVKPARDSAEGTHSQCEWEQVPWQAGPSAGSKGWPRPGEE